jgi:hypothetical protein
MRMNLSLFLTTFASSILCLLVFHSIFDGLRYFFSREARKWPDMWTIGRLSVVSPKGAFGLYIEMLYIYIYIYWSFSMVLFPYV